MKILLCFLLLHRLNLIFVSSYLKVENLPNYMQKEKKIVIIIAGGKGLRMQTETPKQFIELQGKPILMHTMNVFFKYDNNISIILVLPADQIDYWKQLCEQHHFSILHMIVEGGETRFHSVRNGLKHAQDNSLIAIHDGVRPLVNVETIECCFDAATQYGNAVPVVDLVDSVRMVKGSESEIIDRNKLRLVQTPQVFDSQLLLKAYEQAFNPSFTDDASVVETLGTKIHLVEGNRENIKITTPIDIAVAEHLICQ